MGCASDDEGDFDYEEDEGAIYQRPGFQPVVIPPINAFDIAANHPPVALTQDLLDFADACCETFGLSDEGKADVMETAKLSAPFLTIRLYTRLVALNHQMQKSVAAAFLESADFKEHLTRRLQAGLLDPKIPHYVRGTTPRFVRHMIENPAAYNIPPAVQVHFIHSKIFSKAVGSVLSGFRGEMKRKMQKSLTDKQDIATLVNKLIIRGLRVSNEHILQISFLRMYLVEYNQCSTGNDPTKLSYWEFMDSKMEKMRSKSPQAQLKLYQTNLARDKAQYPAPASGAPELLTTGRVPQWQSDVSNALLAMAGYHIDAGHDGDDGVERDLTPGDEQEPPDDNGTGLGAPLPGEQSGPPASPPGETDEHIETEGGDGTDGPAPNPPDQGMDVDTHNGSGRG